MNINRRQSLAALVGGIVAGAAKQSICQETRRGRGKPIRIGQIGVGHAHASKLAVYRQNPDYEVVGIVEPNEQLRQQLATVPAYQGLPNMTQDQLLELPDLDAVLVETEVRDLLDTAEACIAAGKHIHLDKPAGESLPQFRRVVAGARRQNLMLQMGYMYRYNPAVVLLRELLRKGWLGELFEIHCVMSKVIAPEARRELAVYGGGTMFELGCHLIDLVVDLTGKPDKITPFPRQVNRERDSLIDNMLAVFEYPKATATVRSSGVEVEGFARRHFVLCGTQGTFHIQPLDAPKALVAFSQERAGYKRGYQEVTFPKYTRYVDDAFDMAQVIRDEKEADFSYEHDLDVQEAVLRASGLPLI